MIVIACVQLGMEFLAQRKPRKALKALGKSVTMCRSARVERRAHRAIFDTHLRGGRLTDATCRAVEGHMMAWLQLASPASRTGALLELVDLLKYRGNERRRGRARSGTVVTSSGASPAAGLVALRMCCAVRGAVRCAVTPQRHVLALCDTTTPCAGGVCAPCVCTQTRWSRCGSSC